MKIALIGYGTMGKLIRRLAEEKGHEVVVVCGGPRVSEGETSSLSVTPLLTRGLLQSDALAGVDVAIDFSVASAVKRNVAACVAAGVALVEGTTGWGEQRAEIEKIVSEGNGAFVFGANFSIGVNLFYRIAAFAAELFAKVPEYETFLEEQHHSRKLDAPSGTALKIKEIVAEHIKKDFSIAATRAETSPAPTAWVSTAPQIKSFSNTPPVPARGSPLEQLRLRNGSLGRMGFMNFPT